VCTVANARRTCKELFCRGSLYLERTVNIKMNYDYFFIFVSNFQNAVPTPRGRRRKKKRTRTYDKNMAFGRVRKTVRQGSAERGRRKRSPAVVPRSYSPGPLTMTGSRERIKPRSGHEIHFPHVPRPFRVHVQCTFTRAFAPGKRSEPSVLTTTPLQ